MEPMVALGVQLRLPGMEKRKRGRPKGSLGLANVERNAALVQKYQEGIPGTELAATFGISRQRVQQILKKAGLGRNQGGHVIRCEAAHAGKMQRLDEYAIQKWGHTRAEHRFLLGFGTTRNQRSPVGAYMRQRVNAQRHPGWGWNLTLEDWWQCWLASGKWSQRGVGRGKYCLVRKDITQPFAPGNIQIVEFTKAVLIARGDLPLCHS